MFPTGRTWENGETSSTVMMRRLSSVIGTLCGIGYVPVAPGTAASIVAAGLWYWWYPGPVVQWVVCGVAIVVGLWASGSVAKQTQKEDPSEVVIDEFAGMWLVLAGLPKSLLLLCVAFMLFRVFDIIKPPPMKQLERIPGGAGIMLDDVAAGLISRLIVIIGLSLAGVVS